MAIVCPGCGREYDVTLFQFGRTVDCTCGTRVGLERRLSLGRAEGRHGGEGGGAEPRPEPRFLADAMLGGLARWLRILGYDVAYDDSAEDRTLARRAVEEGRRILTRDRRLPREWRVEGVVVVEAERAQEQLREVVRRLELDPDPERAFTRCPRCNGELRPAEPDAVAREVPPGVLERHEFFRRCPGCGKVYWDGGHVRRMRRRLTDLLG